MLRSYDENCIKIYYTPLEMSTQNAIAVLCVVHVLIVPVSGFAQDDDSPSLIKEQVILQSRYIDERLLQLDDQVEGLAQLISDAGDTPTDDDIEAIEQAKKELRINAVESAEETQELMETTTDLINNTLATANLFSNVANTMALLDSAEAIFVDEKTIKAEKLFNSLSDVVLGLGALGGGAVYANDKDDVGGSAALGVTAIALSNVFKRIGDRKQAKNTANWVHDKATQLSIHAFLVLRVKSVSDYMVELERYNKRLILTLKGRDALSNSLSGMNNNSAPDLPREGLNVRDNWADVKKLVDMVDEILSLIEQVDYLYNNELVALRNEIENRSTFSIYTEDGQAGLENLIVSVENARESWKNVRYFYTDIEEALTQFRSRGDELFDNAKPPIE